MIGAEAALLGPVIDKTIEIMQQHGLIASTGEPSCPSTTPGAVRVITFMSTLENRANPFQRVPSVAVDQLLSGWPSTSWTKLKIRTIYSTDPSPARVLSNPSLMIGGKAARTLSEDEICRSIASGEPLDVVWVTDHELSSKD